jgi:hypothetical protein
MEEESPYKNINKKFNSNNLIFNIDPNTRHVPLPNCNKLYDYDSPQLEDLIITSVRMEEGISLSVIKNTSNKKVKKFFHVPDFEIYFIKEIAISDKFFISDYRQKISHWNRTLDNSEKFIKIYNEYVNNPEG